MRSDAIAPTKSNDKKGLTVTPKVTSHCKARVHRIEKAAERRLSLCYHPDTVFMPLTIANYTLPARQNDVPQNLRAEYRAGGFSEAVRNWHLERIPRLTISAGTYITCPWCGKGKDSRSMQIDHIIPIRQYCRYKLLLFSLKNQDKRWVMRDLEANLRRLLKVLYSDEKNLLLSCMKCNAGAGNDMPTVSGLQGAANLVSGSQLAGRLLRLIPVLRDMQRDRIIRDGGVRLDLSDFILNGAHWNTSARNTRGSTSYATKPGTMLGKLSIVHNVVVDKLVKGRPMWSITAGALIPSQPTRNFNNEEGRLCFYCLGLFKKQAFQIDHINPASQRANVPAVYSDPTNLIPVCRTCNTAKGIQSISTKWLDDQIARRQKEGLPGVENASGIVPPPLYASYLDYAKAQRTRVLGY